MVGLVELCTFQNRNPVRVFLYHCISDGNQLFSENFGCHFHFILHVMSDKAAFVSRALFCVQCYRGNLELSRSNSASRWQRINLLIYAATSSVKARVYFTFRVPSRLAYSRVRTAFKVYSTADECGRTSSTHAQYHLIDLRSLNIHLAHALLCAHRPLGLKKMPAGRCDLMTKMT